MRTAPAKIRSYISFVECIEIKLTGVSSARVRTINLKFELFRYSASFSCKASIRQIIASDFFREKCDKKLSIDNMIEANDDGHPIKHNVSKRICSPNHLPFHFNGTKVDNTFFESLRFYTQFPEGSYKIRSSLCTMCYIRIVSKT